MLGIPQTMHSTADLRLRRGWQEPDDLEEILAQMVEAAAIAEVETD